MDRNVKVLGICLAKMQDRVRTEYINTINRAAAINGWKVVIYNTFRDFRKNDLSVQGSRSVYNIVNYDDIDALLVFPESINRRDVSAAIITKAMEVGKPVVVVGAETEGCFSVIRDYEDGFKELVRHVINVHNVKDLFFIGGYKEDDYRTGMQLKFYREVLEESGIPFDESRVEYGNYKQVVVDEIMDRLLQSGKIPKAIICGDDNTAIMVGEKLSEYDLKIPDDVIVTGFGGIPAAYYYHPSISTCSDDVEVFAGLIVDTIEKAYARKEPEIVKNPFKARIRRSCGCDMRSYLSAGRRGYDLAAAKAAGIYVLSDENTKKNAAEEKKEETSEDRQASEQTASIDQNDTEDTVFMPAAAEPGTVRLIRQDTEEKKASDEEGNTEGNLEGNTEGDTGGTQDGTEGYSEEKCDPDRMPCAEMKYGIKPGDIPEYGNGKTGEGVKTDGVTTAQTYEISYGFGRGGHAGDDKGGDNPAAIEKERLESIPESAHHPVTAKIYPSDIFRKNAEIGQGVSEPEAYGYKNRSEDAGGSEQNGYGLNGYAGRNEDAGGSGQNTGVSGPAGGNVQEQNSREHQLEVEKAAKRAMEVAEDKKCMDGHAEARFRSGNHVAYIYRELDEAERREDSVLAWAEKMFELTDMDSICESIAERLPSGCSLYVLTKLLQNGFDIDEISDEDADKQMVTRIESAADSREYPNLDNLDITALKARDIGKGYINGRKDGTMLVINPVFIGNFVCGYITIKTDRASDIRNSIKLLATGLNMIFRLLANQNRQKQMLYNIENSAFVSSMTGLPNLKGLTKWFNEFASKEENRNRILSISVFVIPRYSYIYENYGLNEIEESVRFIVEQVRNVSSKDSYIGQFAEGEFVVIDNPERKDLVYDEDGDPNFARNSDTEAATVESEAERIEKGFRRFDKLMAEHNMKSTKEYFLEATYGTSIVDPGWDATLESMVRVAVNDMYLRQLSKGRMPAVKDRTFDREYFTTFDLLVEKNLFRYHFQPIVDAGTGVICAYEALMRTGGGISMSPLDILDIAKNANRLYDIEKATIFNVMQFYCDHREEFGDRKLFINTIPGHFLNAEDKAEVMERFGDIMDSFVLEVTETDTVTDEDLEKLKMPSPSGRKPGIAVDDYGTGHSNIVNLMRYSPHVVKIDHYLVHDIQSDSNKQMFVKNTIEFAALNGIKVLAEGVETVDELKKVIEYGVDYIQGYYTARPSAEIMSQIPQNIRTEILNESIKAAKFDNDNLVYYAKGGETLNLLELALKKYTVISIPGGKVKIVGEPDNVIDMIIKTADGRKTELILENVNLRGELETTIQLGRNSETALFILGECTLNKDGILVPASSRLSCSGSGNLHIITSRNLSIGIGSNCNEPYGDLSFDMTGTVKIVANGDKAAGIGGGRSDGSRIRLINGHFDISAKAIHAVAVGSDAGDTDIYIGRNVVCRLKSDGNDSIAMGSISGKSEIVSRGRLEIIGDGEKTVGIGSIYGFTKTDLLNNEINVTLHSYCGMGIGSLTGKAALRFEDTPISVYAEGTQINGLGSGEDAARIEICGGDVKTELLAGIPRALGIQKGKAILRFGSFTSLHDKDVSMTNERGEVIKPEPVDDGVRFTR